MQPWTAKILDVDANSIPATEEELRAAIARLKASTGAVERRTKIVTSQGALVDQFRSSNAEIRVRRTGYVHYIKQKENAEVQHTKFAVGVLRFEAPAPRPQLTLDRTSNYWPI